MTAIDYDTAPDLSRQLAARAPDGDSGARSRQSLASLLHRAARAERRRASAWLLAGAVTAAVALALGSDVDALTAAVIGGGLGLWSTRQALGIELARRDFERADTPPRRAYVMLLDDPNPKALRPLLAVWPRRPAPGERLAKPESVWRCDGELRELECTSSFPAVHQAWLDTGPRSWSTPRWVSADAGVALPHRRALFGRWYVSALLRKARPEEPRPLTLGHPHTVPQTGEELPLEGSLTRSVAPRVAFLAILLAVGFELA